MVVPNDLGEAEICDLDLADATRTDTLDELALIDLVLVSGLFWLRVLGGNKRYLSIQNVFWLDVSIGRASAHGVKGVLDCVKRGRGKFSGFR